MGDNYNKQWINTGQSMLVKRSRGDNYNKHKTQQYGSGESFN